MQLPFVQATLKDFKLLPVLMGSAFRNKGVQPLLDAVVWYLPSPVDLPPVLGFKPGSEHEVLTRRADDAQPFSALAFKTVSDSFRVGMATMNNNKGADFIPLAPFDTAQKALWYAKLYAANPSNFSAGHLSARSPMNVSATVCAMPCGSLFCIAR